MKQLTDTEKQELETKIKEERERQKHLRETNPDLPETLKTASAKTDFTQSSLWKYGFLIIILCLLALNVFIFFRPQDFDPKSGVYLAPMVTLILLFNHIAYYITTKGWKSWVMKKIIIKAVLFDLDGTLCDSDTAWRIAENETFQRLRKHYPHLSEETITKAWTTVHQRLFHRLDTGKCSMAEVRDARFPCLFKELNLPTDKTMEELSDFFCSRYLTSLRLYDDVTVFEELSEYHVGIITNGAHDEHTDSQFSKVRYLGLSDRIQSLTISGEIGVRKPNLEIFRVAWERADVLPKEAVYVGDTIQNDIVGANRAGMTSIFINRKSERPIPKTADEQPDYTTSSLHEVLSCLEHSLHSDDN